MTTDSGNNTAHWDGIYGRKASDAVTWFAPHLSRSLAMISDATKDAVLSEVRVIDVGAGASTLVDDLLDRGFSDVTLLDLSDQGLSHTRSRLGASGEGLQWLVGDVTTVDLPHHGYDVWHDRAVFHFLTDPAARAAYVAQVLHAVRPGGQVIIGTFGEDGPERCSGLEVVRFTPDALHAAFGAPFLKVDEAVEAHHTPWDTDQQFTWCRCVIRPS